MNQPISNLTQPCHQPYSTHSSLHSAPCRLPRAGPRAGPLGLPAPATMATKSRPRVASTDRKALRGPKTNRGRSYMEQRVSTEVVKQWSTFSININKHLTIINHHQQPLTTINNQPQQYQQTLSAISTNNNINNNSWQGSSRWSIRWLMIG